jgi:hypothetical protein
VVEWTAEQGREPEKMEYLLLVTWFLGAQSTTSYQVPFASRQACDTALSDLRNEARRLSASQDTMRTPSAPPATGADARSPGTPVLAAICVNQR